MGESKLSAKRERFCREYVVDCNGTQAALRAGYSSSCAKVTAARLLTDDNVKARVAELQKKTAEKIELTAEMALRELMKSLKMNGQIIETESGEMIANPTAHNKAVELAMRYNAMLVDRKDVKMEVNADDVVLDIITGKNGD